ncbi:MAG: hypothetical protein H7195_09295 [Chryseobacterium sp.]|nr:hypothetical protein [Chryseobacterium sp.]
MKRKLAAAFVFALLLTNCSAEKVNLSPISDNITDDLYTPSDLNIRAQTISYQSAISNLISTFPKFNNDAVDKEVNNLKLSLTNYIKSISSKNIKLQKKYFKNYVIYYKKIQKLRRYLNQDKDNVLNRYLVRIKTNVNLLKSIN